MSDAGDVAAIYDLTKHIWVTPDVLDTKLEPGIGPLHFDVPTPVPVAGEPLRRRVTAKLARRPQRQRETRDKPWVTDYGTEDNERSLALTRVAFVASPVG